MSYKSMNNEAWFKKKEKTCAQVQGPQKMMGNLKQWMCCYQVGL